MKYYAGLLTLVVLFLTNDINGIAQPKGAVSRSHFYHQVITYTLDTITNEYILNDTIMYTGAISIDRAKIFIRSYDNAPNYNLRIQSYYKGDSLTAERYDCNDKGVEYVFYLNATDPKQIIFTLQTKAYKKIYYGKPISNPALQDKEIKTKVILFDNQPIKSQTTYLELFLEIKPILKGELSLEVSKEIIQKRIGNVVKELFDTIPSFNIYVSFVVTLEGDIRDISIMNSNADINTNNQIINTLKTFNKWEPGIQDNKAVDVLCYIEFEFRADK